MLKQKNSKKSLALKSSVNPGAAPCLAVVGTVAIDRIQTPFGKRDKVFGGSASYFSYAASFFTRVALVAVVGNDFPAGYRKILADRKINLSHLGILPGKTFSWTGKYETDLNSAITLDTGINVLGEFDPVLNFSPCPEYLFLANIDPVLQLKVLKQMPRPKVKYVACDTMNYWIASKKKDLLEVFKHVDCVILNDGEARQLTGETNLVKAARQIRDFGPGHIVIKKGEHGALLFYENSFSVLPAYPLESVFDPTGAGDTFAGAFMGRLASLRDSSKSALKSAIAHGTIMASFTVEDFGLDRLRRLDMKQFSDRFKLFKAMLQIPD